MHASSLDRGSLDCVENNKKSAGGQLQTSYKAKDGDNGIPLAVTKLFAYAANGSKLLTKRLSMTPVHHIGGGPVG